MSWLQVWVLALVQGLTEFLPISSAAHLILVPILTAWEDQGLAFDVAIHVGTLVAIVAYFRREVIVVTQGWFGQFSQLREWRAGRPAQISREAMLGWAVILGTIPAGLAGLLFSGAIELHLRDAIVIAVTSIVFGLLLLYADLRARGARSEYELRWIDIVLIGLAQALALIPGTSRSGATMTAALLLGFSRTAAARYSFLLAIPIIALAGAYQTVKLLGAPPETVRWDQLALGAVVAGVSAWLAVHYFLRFIERIGMWPFVVYRIALGVVLLWLFL
ncbi:MAG: undecaprenyl-diphosphate phosphatase [Thioalkalivibrionaceae bacterium]